jgi:hypothetical protein
MPQLLSRISRSAAFRGRALKKKFVRKWGHFRATPLQRHESKHQRFAGDLAEIAHGLDGKRIFEIGSDSDAQFLREVIASGASFAAGVNPAIRTEIDSTEPILCF